MIVAEPSATAVTSPADDTVATVSADVAHVTVALAIVAPFWSMTVAVSCVVAPEENKLRLVAESVIEVATSVGVGVGVGVVGVVGEAVGPVPPSPHASSKSTATNVCVLVLKRCVNIRPYPTKCTNQSLSYSVFGIQRIHHVGYPPCSVSTVAMGSWSLGGWVPRSGLVVTGIRQEEQQNGSGSGM